MTIIEAFAGNNLAKGIYHSVENISFGNGYDFVPVTTSELAQKIKDSSLGGLDYRAKMVPEPGFASVFDGLAFDPENVRTQSFALLARKEKEPVGVMSAVIAPQSWILNQRYFQRATDGVRICDFSTISNDKIPEYLIIPAWTKVVPDHLVHFAIPGFRAFHKVMAVLQESAPENTWMEAIAQGEWPMSRNEEMLQLLDRGLGAYIDQAELPFQLEQVGKNNKGSLSSVKMAPLMGLQRIGRLGSARTLGPVFAKRVK